VHPLDALIAVLLLLPLQHQLNEQLLQLLIAVVDAELLKAVHVCGCVGVLGEGMCVCGCGGVGRGDVCVWVWMCWERGCV